MAATTAQIRSDPRIQDVVQKNRTGRILAKDLQALGFDVPDGYSFSFGGRAGYGTLMDDKRGLAEKLAPVIALGLGAAAGGLALAPATGPALTSTAAAPSIGGVSTGGLFAPAGGLVGTSAATGATAAVTGAPIVAAATPSLASTLLRYGLQYGTPVVGGLISSRVAANANTDAARLENQYNNRALDAAIEEQTYQRRQGEDERAYQRRIDAYERDKYSEGTGYDRSKYAEGEGYKRASDQEATNYGRRNYGNFVETLEPYRATGVAANQYAARLMGQKPAPYTGGTYYDLARDARTPVNLPTNVNLPTGAPNLNFPSTGESGAAQSGVGSGGAPTSGTMPVGGSPQLVTMRAPDGTVKQVPANQREHYESLGAVAV